MLRVSGDLPFKVRPPGHWEWLHVKSFFAYIWLCQSRSWPYILKLGGWCKATGSYNMYIYGFSYWWPKVRSISWPRHHKTMGRKSNPSFTHQARQFYHELSNVRLLLMIQVQILVDDLHRGHLGSYDVIRDYQQVFANNWRLKRATGMDVVSLCWYCHDASTDTQHELFGSTFDLRRPWSVVKYWPDPFKVTIVPIWFDAPLQEEYAGARIKPLAVLVQMLFAKRNFLANPTILFFILSAQAV